LGLIMGLCLLVYNLGQRQLRKALEQKAQTIPSHQRNVGQRTHIFILV